jgi:hypothetical protein
VQRQEGDEALDAERQLEALAVPLEPEALEHADHDGARRS